MTSVVLVTAGGIFVVAGYRIWPPIAEVGMMTGETVEAGRLAPRYQPSEVERRWYPFWLEHGYFKPELDSKAPPFVITIPPPNVTGVLHIGHVLTYGIEDVVGRFKRMQGFNTLIVPGMDHASIAIQMVVEKELANEGHTRQSLGREAFIERVWSFKDDHAARIRAQFQALGAGFDWSRERFTLDPAYSDAVLEFFIRLYEEGKIYRGWRVVNWCPRCRSTISDIEVEQVEREDTLYYLRYPLKDGDGSIVVATVRPETILGDVAVAVHPADERYQNLIGRTAVLPLLGRDLEIVGDEMVDREFGTGAVKITPAHDFADFEVAQRHDLDMPILIDADGRLTSVGGAYQGQSITEARENVLLDLRDGGYLVKSEPYRHAVPTCERCHTVIEPLLSEQWFMKMEELAEPAMDVVRKGEIRFVPDRWARIYLDWMEHIRPWNISRQLWFGHRIPIYYCANGHAVAAKSWPEACSRCNDQIVRQDEDILDTWFSSALWPFATLGWPEETVDLGTFYPTSFMSTSSQILYLWIARMIMTGLKFMDEIPFPVVLISPTVLTGEGQRMSKSLGTGSDPMQLVEMYGADALRFALMTAGNTHQQDTRFSVEKVELARNFTNKYWNVARFILGEQEAGEVGDIRLEAADKWILSRLAHIEETVTSGLERYELAGPGQALHDFIWSEVADWYLEIAKPRLYDKSNLVGRGTAQAVLWSVLDRVTRLLHPYMPFITEEVWQHLRNSAGSPGMALSSWNEPLPESVMISPWPEPGERDA
ncbi:MAG: valine--tRNA ligase, partial [Chloroflexota bacterium]